MYSLFETSEFIESIERLPVKDAAFVRQKLHDYVYPQLRQEPHFGNNIKKLRSYEPPTWRYRIGRYRVFYSVDDKGHIVLLLTLEQRKDAYR